jgi:hypothetical protein
MFGLISGKRAMLRDPDKAAGRFGGCCHLVESRSTVALPGPSFTQPMPIIDGGLETSDSIRAISEYGKECSASA